MPNAASLLARLQTTPAPATNAPPSVNNNANVLQEVNGNGPLRSPIAEESEKTVTKSPTSPSSLVRSASAIDLHASSTRYQSRNRLPEVENSGLKRNLSEATLSSSFSSAVGGGEEGYTTNKSPQRSQSMRHNMKMAVEGLVPAKSSLLPGFDTKIAISKIAVTDSIGEEQEDSTDCSDTDRVGRSNSGVKRSKSGKKAHKSRTTSTPFHNFSRKSWYIPSRSPSPKPREKVVETRSSDTNGQIGPETQLSRNSLDKENVSVGGTDSPPSTDTTIAMPAVPRPVKRRGTLSSKKIKRPLSAFLGKSSAPALEGIAQMPALPRSLSTDQLPLLKSAKETVPETPTGQITPLSLERMQNAGPEPKKKDELWGNFRTLDSEYQKFTSKPSTLKVNIVRSNLLPFLRNHADHPSNTALRAEDLDRRVNILNKWWTGLLEMLNGRNGQSVSGTDRPVILESVTAIMIRPEWKLTVSSLVSRQDKGRASMKSRSTTSLESTSSEFLAESVVHNVRNTFVQNLLSQMAFVVEKMSMRSVPASIVTFCGKAAAFAFFYCSGVADILVKLWNISPATLQRTLREIGIERSSNMTQQSERLAAKFPPHLRPLAFRSLAISTRRLRNRPQIPLSTAYITWFGPWVGRWTGRDSELFFVFLKQYYVLSSEYTPLEAPAVERACTPAHVLVQAQLLSVLDSTIHRTPPPTAPHISELNEGPSSLTFDDVLGADANAVALPIPPPSAIRVMAENRVIVLLREFLSETSKVPDADRRSFAQMFATLLRAMAHQTSLFDHSACFVLCDFLEETLAIILRYCASTADSDGNSLDPFDLLDWSFWLDVCKRMMESNNSMTEVRVFSFVYALWGMLINDEGRKADLCLGWLLRKDVFEKQFCHWCPMVRAYYMRLLCWRVGRLDIEASEMNLRILSTLFDRLATTWAYYLFMRDDASYRGLLPPSTAPCNAAPVRRLLIVRSDTHHSPSSLYISFDGLLAATSVSHPTAFERHNSIESVHSMAAIGKADNTNRSASPNRKRWEGIKSLFFSANEKGKPSTSPPTTDNPDKQLSNSTTNEDSSTPSAPAQPRPSSSSSSTSTSSVSTARSTASTPTNHHSSSSHHHGMHFPKPQTTSKKHQTHSFKFSLESLDRANLKIRDQKLSPPRLPYPAQTFLQMRRNQASLQQASTNPIFSPHSHSHLHTSQINTPEKSISSLSSSPSSSSHFSSSQQTQTSSSSTSTSSSSQAAAAAAVAAAATAVGGAIRANGEIGPLKPEGQVSEAASRYAGRALAEWALVIVECQNFFDRRKHEGVPGYRLVETPALGVENLRKLG
ncbi:hypothetical protein MMC25_006036 [Agyrium rufum]|nr:hypothetical protein [Agyrium rufum]